MSYIDTMKLGLEALEKYCTPYQDGTHPADEAITALREAIAEQPAQDQRPFCYHDGRNIVGKEFAEHSDVFPLYTAPQPEQQDWEAIAADQAMTIAMLKSEQPAQGCDHCNHSLYAGTKCKNCGRVTEQAAIKQDLTPEQPAQQQQEPVAWMYPDDYQRMTTSETFCTVFSVECGSPTQGKTTVPLYTSPPPQRKPLTDEEIFALRDAYAGHLRWGVKDFARAIEAKHGITGEQK